MADSPDLREAMAAAITIATHVSLHTDDPAGTGANEVTGGDPAYARVPITAWTAGTVDGVYTATLDAPFDLPAGTSILWAGLWNGTTYLDKAPCIINVPVQSKVQIKSVTFTVPAPVAA